MKLKEETRKFVNLTISSYLGFHLKCTYEFFEPLNGFSKFEAHIATRNNIQDTFKIIMDRAL